MLTEGLFTSRTDEWATPASLFAELDAEFHFNLDPCSTHENAKCEKHYTIEDDGLTKNWGGVQSFLQPSIRAGHSRLGAEVRRGSQEARHPRRHAHPGKDGYCLLPRLHLPQSTGDSFHPRPDSLQRE